MRKRRVTQIVLWCFLVLVLIAPVYESFDHWDGSPVSGNDTVLNIIAVVTFAGLVLVAAKHLLWLLATAFSNVPKLFARRSSALILVGRSTIGESPPPLLLSPLRV